MKSAAKRHGLPPDRYAELRAAGMKRCVACREWKAGKSFGLDTSRGDGRSAICAECKDARARHTYRPIAPEDQARRGPPRLDRREGDAAQARHRINADVRMGQRPNPNDLHCARCGHKGSDRRHEYHHHRGYGIEHQNDVLCLCSPCHHAEHRR